METPKTDWKAAKSMLTDGQRVDARIGDFGHHHGDWTEVAEIKGHIGFGSRAIMVRVARSNGYILLAPETEYRAHPSSDIRMLGEVPMA